MLRGMHSRSAHVDLLCRNTLTVSSPLPTLFETSHLALTVLEVAVTVKLGPFSVSFLLVGLITAPFFVRQFNPVGGGLDHAWQLKSALLLLAKASELIGVITTTGILSPLGSAQTRKIKVSIFSSWRSPAGLEIEMSKICSLSWHECEGKQKS